MAERPLRFGLSDWRGIDPQVYSRANLPKKGNLETVLIRVLCGVESRRRMGPKDHPPLL
jgi:hypothetical protein